MKQYKMKLMTKYFDYIKNGTKRIELRLNDEKRKNIAFGDEIVFEELSNNPRYLKAKVVDLYYESNFQDLINQFDIKLLADKDITKEELLTVLNEIYSLEEQNKYGVVGIQLDLLED